MVKGTTRQVIVVRSPDPKLFEQAIFLLKEDAMEKHGLGEREILEQARRICCSELPKKKPRRPHSPPLPCLSGGQRLPRPAVPSAGFRRRRLRQPSEPL